LTLLLLLYCCLLLLLSIFLSFLFNDTATTYIYTLSLHDALPIFGIRVNRAKKSGMVNITSSVNSRERSGINTILHELNTTGYIRSEERFSRNAETDLVCRLLLEKKKTKNTAKNVLLSQINTI